MRKTRICPPVGAKMCGVTRVLMIGPLLLWAMCRTMRPHLAQGLRLRRPARPRAAMVVQTRRPAPREKARPRIPTPKPSGLEWAASSTKCQNPTPTQPLPLHASAFLSRFRGHLIPPTVEYSHRTTPQLTQPALMIRLPGPAQVLVLSGKGGVGKSTVASQLAMALSGDGADTGSAPRHAPYTPSSLARVLPEARRRRAEPPPVGRLLDIDICGPSAPRMLGAEAEEVRQAGTGWQPVWVADRLCVMSIGFMLPSRRDAVVWRGARKHALVRQFLRDVESPPPPLPFPLHIPLPYQERAAPSQVEWGALEFLVVDAPPGTSDEHITLAQALRGAGAVAAVVVTTPQEVALLDVRKELSFCAKAGIPVLGLVENMAAFVCPHCAQESSIFPPAPAPGGAGAGAGGGEGLAAESGVPFLGRVPLDSALAAACEAGRAVDASAASGRALRAVAARVVQELEARFGAPA